MPSFSRRNQNGQYSGYQPILFKQFFRRRIQNGHTSDPKQHTPFLFRWEPSFSSFSLQPSLYGWNPTCPESMFKSWFLRQDSKCKSFIFLSVSSTISKHDNLNLYKLSNIRTLSSSHKGYINVRTHRGKKRHHSWIWVSKDEIWRSFGNSFDTKIQERCNNSIVKIYDVVPNDGWVSSFVPVLKPPKNENPTIRWVSDFCPLNEKN